MREREIERDKDTAGFFRSFEGKRERERERERVRDGIDKHF